MPLAKPDPLQRVIVDAALEIASGVGPDAISMRELARQANVSHQAPYHHFGDRAGIFAAICEEGFAILGNEMQENRNLGAEALCESYVRFALNHRGHFRVMFRTDLCDMASYPNAAIQQTAHLEFCMTKLFRLSGSRCGRICYSNTDGLHVVGGTRVIHVAH